MYVSRIIINTGNLFAAGPGKGSITAYPGGGINSFTVKYNISQLMGEPTVNGVFKWEAQSGYNNTLPANTVVWLEVCNSMGKAFIKLDPVFKKSGQGYGMNTTGSPSWSRVLILEWQGSRALKYADTDTAKAFWKQGFRVSGAHLGW